LAIWLDDDPRFGGLPPVLVLTAATWVFALLLTAAGARKLAQPGAAAAALQAARLPSGAPLVRLLGAGEVAVGLAALVFGGTIPSALLALAYAAVAAFAEHQRRRGAGCGCFGAPTTPATGLHVALNITAAVSAAGTALWPAASLPATIAHRPLLGLLAATLAGIACSLLRLLLTAGAELANVVALVEPRTDA
jgi:hypothetical protein